MSQWDYKIDQPMPGPFRFPNLRKGPGIEVGHTPHINNAKNISIVTRPSPQTLDRAFALTLCKIVICELCPLF